MSVTVSEILIAARGALAAVSSETAGYLVLGAADCLGEGKLGLGSVYLDEGGTFRVERHGDPAGIDVESSLRTLLKRLLETGRSPAPALLRVATTQERQGVPRLVTEIEAALIPVNRAAARRALARLHRDVSRARTKELFEASAGELLVLEPSNSPPAVVVARAVAPRIVAPKKAFDRSTEGPTPVVPVVEETYRPAPAPLLALEPDATPFLGTAAPTAYLTGLSDDDGAAAAAPSPPSAEIEGDPEAEVDTDPAPLVDFEAGERVETPGLQGSTVVIGTYDVGQTILQASPSPSEPPPRLEEVLQVSPSPSEAALYVAIPVVAWREPAPDGAEIEERDLDSASESAAVDERKGPDELEADALELVLFDAGDEKPDTAGTFASMFELAPDGTAEPPAVTDDDALFDALPPVVFSIATWAKNPDAIADELGIEVPATPLAEPIVADDAAAIEVDDPVQESSFGHLTEALIDEALAVEPRPLAVQPVQPAVHAPAIPHTETAPGLGFVNVALVPPAAEGPPDATAPDRELATDEPISECENEIAALSDVVNAPAELVSAAVEDVSASAEDVSAPVDDVAPAAVEDVSASAEDVSAPVDDVAAALAENAGVWEPATGSWDDEPCSDYYSPTPSDVVAGVPTVASTYQPRRSDVADLVAAFVVAESRSLAELARELKRIAGILAPEAPAGARAEAVSGPRRKASSAR